MIFSKEQALLKARVDLQDLVAFACQAAAKGSRIDQVERELMRRLLALGLTLLQLFIAEHGDAAAPHVEAFTRSLADAIRGAKEIAA